MFLELTIFYHAGVMPANGTPLACYSLPSCWNAAEKDMKIYLLVLLIGTILTAIRFTSVPEQRSKTLPQ
jgi:hypothetical protein